MRNTTNNERAKSMKTRNQSLKQNKSTDYVVVCIKPEDYELIDFRTNKPIYFYSNPLSEEEGSAVFQELDEIQFQTKINGEKNTLNYFAPNSVGILLSTANKALIEAKKIYDVNINPDKVNHFSSNNLEQIGVKSKIIYDYIEQIQISIVFGYTALETFVNLSIPDSYEYSDKNSKGIIETYNKEAIERWLQLRVKLSDILVKIYKTKPIKSNNIWNKLLSFEDIRNDIVHQKTINSTKFYKKYFQKNIFNICKVPEEIIQFFFDEREDKDQTNPLWPWVINASNDFPSRMYKSEQVEIFGNIFEGRHK